MSLTSDLTWATSHRHFFSHLVTMPSWHKIVLITGALLAMVGGIGHATTPKPAPAAQVSSDGSAPAGTSGMVGSSGATSTDDGIQIGTFGKISPHMMGVGFSVIVGFVLGWFFRAFIKSMAMIAILGGGIVWALSHFNILHLSDDSVAKIKENSAEATSWMTAHATQLKDFVIAHLPSSGSGSLGAFIGFRRK